MNETIAERLFLLRKQRGLSQEELADLTEVSRQAMSKWERGEAVPDIDKLIKLSQIYDVSIDSIVKGNAEESEEDDFFRPLTEEAASEPLPEIKVSSPEMTEKYPEMTESTPKNEFAEMGSDMQKAFTEMGKDMKETFTQFGQDMKKTFAGNYAEPTQSPNMEIRTAEPAPDAQIAGLGFNSLADGEEPFKNTNWKMLYAFPIYAVAIGLMFLFGMFFGCWEWSWLFVLAIPLYYTTVSAMQKRNPAIFCYPVLMVIVQMIGGFWFNMWATSWIGYLTIPFYYTAVVPYLKKHVKYFRDK